MNQRLPSLVFAESTLKLPLYPWLRVKESFHVESVQKHAALFQFMRDCWLPLITIRRIPKEIVIIPKIGQTSYHTAVPGLLRCNGKLRVIFSRLIVASSFPVEDSLTWLNHQGLDSFSHESGHAIMRSIYGFVPRSPDFRKTLFHSPEENSDGITAFAEGFALFMNHMAATTNLLHLPVESHKSLQLWRSELACGLFLAIICEKGLSLSQLYTVMAKERPLTFYQLFCCLEKSPQTEEICRKGLKNVRERLPIID